MILASGLSEDSVVVRDLDASKFDTSNRDSSYFGVAFGERSDGDLRRDAEARTAMSATLGISDAWSFVDQVHGTFVVTVNQSGNCGEGDAVMTGEIGLPIAITTADCVPLVLVARDHIAVVHCGWRGIVGGIVEESVQAMRDAGADPAAAIIGPHIGSCCYEVGTEVVEALGGHESTTTFGTRSVSLAAAIHQRLPKMEFVDIDMCTMHDERFHSFRDTATNQRQVTVAWLRQAS